MDISKFGLRSVTALCMAAVIAAAIAVAGCSRPASSESVTTGVQPIPGAFEESFSPLAEDPSAMADANDVLISADKAKAAPALAEGKWINSQPLTLAGLRGRVVYLEFWTYSCYNCVNTLPTVKRFDRDFREKGLTVIGVQSPEFEREKLLENINTGVRKLDVKYPVVTDNEMKSWEAYGVNAWPTIVIIDRDGRIRYRHVGEGHYDVQEQVIKTLLAAGGSKTTAGSDAIFDGKKIERSVEEWRAALSSEAFHVLREEGTERSYSGQYNKHKEAGIYACGACGLALFDSKTKFESGTGWPSFYQPINAKNVVEKVDRLMGISRTEVECARCGSHLGHVFDDGPEPTGLRYCMNSVALGFEKNN